MSKTVLETLQADFQYRGNYATPALDLVPHGINLLKNALQQLSPLGLNLRGFRVDGNALPDIALNINIPELSFTARVLLDHLEVNVWKLHEIGTDVARKLLLASWSSMHETDASIEISAHVVWLNFYARPVGGSTYQAMMEQFTRIPAGLAEKGARSGVGFYFPADPAKGLHAGSLVVDRWAGPDDGVSVKLTIGFDGKMVSAEQVADRTEEHLRWLLEQLDIQFEQVK